MTSDTTHADALRAQADDLQTRQGGVPSSASAALRMAAAYASTEDTADAQRAARVAYLDPSQRDSVAQRDPEWRARLLDADKNKD